MLVLSRRLKEEIVIDGNIRVVVLSISGNRVRLGIEAPPNVAVWRDELPGAVPNPDLVQSVAKVERTKGMNSL